MELSDAQWEVIAPMFPVGLSGPGLKGRPRRGNREVLEGLLWVLRTGARWKDLPPAVRRVDSGWNIDQCPQSAGAGHGVSRWQRYE